MNVSFNISIKHIHMIYGLILIRNVICIFFYLICLSDGIVPTLWDAIYDIKTKELRNSVGFNISAFTVYESNGWRLQQQRFEWTAEWTAKHVRKYMKGLNKQTEQTN